MMQSRGSKANWFGARTLYGLSNYYTSLFGPVIDPGETNAQQILDTLFAGIVAEKFRWDVIDLHPLDVDAPVFNHLMAACRNAGLLPAKYFCFGNWYLKVNNRTFSEYLSTRNSRLSKTGKRQRKLLQERGRLRFELFTNVDGLDRAIADYDIIYNSSWKGHEPYPNFMSGLMRTFAKQGSLRLGIAYMGGQPAAAQLWIVSEGTASIYKMAYDERFRKDSVGTVLSMQLMEHVIDVDKVHVVDYLSGDDDYKRDWMSDRRERWGIVAFNPRTPWGLLAAARHFGGIKIKHALESLRHLRGVKT
jgi:CelD/BcsL family acetyltransferase involved in cellulose biosynthesis